MGVLADNYFGIEKGKYNPSLELAFKICDFFSRNIEDIFLYKEVQ